MHGFGGIKGQKFELMLKLEAEDKKREFKVYGGPNCLKLNPSLAMAQSHLEGLSTIMPFVSMLYTQKFESFMLYVVKLDHSIDKIGFE